MNPILLGGRLTDEVDCCRNEEWLAKFKPSEANLGDYRTGEWSEIGAKCCPEKAVFTTVISLLRALVSSTCRQLLGTYPFSMRHLASSLQGYPAEQYPPRAYLSTK